VKSAGDGQKRKQLWTAIAGSIGFCLIGLAFVPGLVSQQPTPAPAPAEAPTVPSVYDPSATPTPEKPVYDNRPALGAASPIAFSSHSFDCMISANETIEIGSSILGALESILVERSDYVEAGQTLAILESTVERAAVRVAQARADRTGELESTRVSLRLGNKRRIRALDLYEKDSISLDLREEVETQAQLAELGVQQAKENHRLAALQLEQAQATLARRTIRSPIAGVVVERLMAAGEVVDEETILTIAQIDPLRVEVILPTHLFGSVSPGDSVEILPEPPLDQPRIAEVALVDRMLDGASGTFGVRLLLPNPDHGLPGGLRCQARLMPPGSEPAAPSDQASADSSVAH
jgi:RND family efflux transporter MFP subunit